MLVRCCFIGLFWLMVVNLFAQQRQIDSLLRLEKNYQKEDTIRAKLLTDIGRLYYSSDPSKGLIYADKAIALAEKLPEKKFLANAFSVKGANKLTKADFPGALDAYLKALSINESINNLQGTGNNYNNIGLVYQSIFDYPRALEYHQKTLSINERTGNKTGMANSLGNIGNIYYELQDYPNAISYYDKALKMSESIGNLLNISGNLVNLGNAYTQLPDLPKALEYKQKALEINEKLGNKSRIASNLGNIGNVYTELGDYNQAIKYHQRALTIFENINDKKEIAAIYSGMGKATLLQKNFGIALEYQRKAKDIAHQVGFLTTERDALLSLSQIYESTGRFDSAFLAYQSYVLLKDSINNTEKQKEVTRKALRYEFSKTEDSLKQQQVLTDVKLNQQILLAAKQQQELLLQQNVVELANQEKALQRLAYLKAQSDLQSEQTLSKANEEKLLLAEKENSLQSVQVDLQQSQLQLKDTELRRQKTQKIIFLCVLILLALLLFFIFRNFRIQQKSNQIISREKKKSDDLLLNILPGEVAAELKEKGHASAKQFDSVTVLFTDFVDFTKVSEQLSPQELVSELHYCFKTFDEIIEKHGLEKIKTIGDAYMAVSGLPVTHQEHAQNAVRAALDIQAFVRQRQATEAGAFNIRIGLNSGPVVAGIVGVKKFAYDIWGDTVNTAARMESSSEPGKINLSGATYALVKDRFSCTHRGKITAKNKGEIDMYFLSE